MSLREGWTPEEYEVWSELFAVFGIAAAFVWLGTDIWVFGLLSIVCAVFAYWAWIEKGRNK